MTRALHAVLPLLLVCLGSLTGCAGTDDAEDGDWARIEVRAPSAEVLWQITRLALQREKLPVQDRFDPLEPSASTGWFVSLAPFKGQGYRERAHIRYERLAEGEFRVSARVERETNQALARPLDISYADWKAAEDNTARARILLQRIRTYLDDTSGFEVGDQPDPFR